MNHQDCTALTNYCTCILPLTGVDADAARREEEETMLADANQLLKYDEVDGKHTINRLVEDQRHPKTGATGLHVAAAKGYIKVMR